MLPYLPPHSPRLPIGYTVRRCGKTAEGLHSILNSGCSAALPKHGAHRLLQTRARTLDGTLHTLFTAWYPGMAADDDNISDHAEAA